VCLSGDSSTIVPAGCRRILAGPGAPGPVASGATGGELCRSAAASLPLRCRGLWPSPPHVSRRQALSVLAAAASTAAGAMLAKPRAAEAYTLFWNDSAIPTRAGAGSPDEQLARVSGRGQASRQSPKDGFTVYKVQNTEDVTLRPVTLGEAVDFVGEDDVNVVFLGEHHWSYVDHALEAKIIEELHQQHRRPQALSVGLEMVQQRFQSVLDAYINRSIDELDLYIQTDWDTLWVWPFEQYLPVLRVARKLSIPLVALSADSETLNHLDDVPNLAELERQFGENNAFQLLSSKDAGFQAYINANILTSYATHVRSGLLPGKPSFDRFYRRRIVRDEAMAANCEKYLMAKPNAFLVCLLGIDHVKFGEYGVPGRLFRRINESATRNVANQDRSVQDTAESLAPEKLVLNLKTVLLNPIAGDAYNGEDGSLMLDLPIRGRPAVPISDLLWFSSNADASPVQEMKRPPRRRPTRRLSDRLPQVEELVF
jgi:uncharacterized iron-regulated protein